MEQIRNNYKVTHGDSTWGYSTATWEDENYNYTETWDKTGGYTHKSKKWNKCSIMDKILLRWL